MPPTLDTMRQSQTRHAASTGADDYPLVRKAIGYLSDNWSAQPDLDQIAAEMGLGATQAQKLFKRWCGLSPKEFVQALSIDHARTMLARGASVLDASYGTGLSSGGRLHDLFVTYEAMTPGEAKRQGAGLAMHYGFHPTPFGEVLAVVTPRGLAGLAFVNEDAGETRAETLAGLAARWPFARFEHGERQTAPWIARIFGAHGSSQARPLRLVLIGTDWEVRVWDALLRVPLGHAVAYSDIARRVCTEKATRAVGRAVGKNPISFVVPCHRVLRADGNLGGYHWGLTRKQALIGWEAGRLASVSR